MKRLLTAAFILPIMAFGQYNVAYTVTVKKLMAKADPCDGGTPPFCLAAPQDPVFNIWSYDGEGQENTYCWVFENDPQIEYNMWKDIQDVEIANETNTNTGFISFDMAGFESDIPTTPNCNADPGDDQIIDRTFVAQFDLQTIPAESTYIDTINLQGIYYAQIEIWWEDLNAGLEELIDQLAVTMAPNPSNGSFSVQMKDETIQQFEINITDISGRKVYAEQVNNNNTTVNLEGQEEGMYFVNISADGKSTTKTMVLTF